MKPKDIKTSDWFWDSVFQNTECEIILRNVVLLQKNVNPEDWTPFTWDEYKAFCTHGVTDSEKRVLDAFVKGGKPTWNTSAWLSPGWMTFDESTNKYAFSQRLISALKKYRIDQCS